MRPQRQSSGTRPPANWSGQISHGRLGVVPLLDTGAAVSRAFQMLRHITPGLMERTVPQNKFTPSSLLSCRDAPDLLTYGSTLLITSQFCPFFSALQPSAMICTDHAKHFELCVFTRIHSDLYVFVKMPVKMLTFVLVYYRNGMF